MAPISRSAALRPLSAGHHEVLLVAFTVKSGLAGRGGAGPAPSLAELQALVGACVAEQLGPHFAAEEALLLPAGGADAERLADEHRRLAALGAEVAKAEDGALREALSGFATLLDAHVRWEERELFGKIEAALPGEALAALGEKLAALAPLPACQLGKVRR